MGCENRASCQPLAVSLTKVALASNLPDELHRCAVWVPIFTESFQKRMPVMVPEVDAENSIPSSTELMSLWVRLSGTAVLPNRSERAVALIVIPGCGVSVLRLSSVARDRIVCVPAVAFHL